MKSKAQILNDDKERRDYARFSLRLLNEIIFDIDKVGNLLEKCHI